MKTRVLPLLVLAGLATLAKLSAASDPAVKLTRADDRVRVEIGGQLFTEYIFKGGPKPYMYPVLAADGTELMRHYPMKDVPTEIQDHPHHRSLWFTHGAVNGIDFWAESELKKEGQTKQGTIVSEGVESSVKGGVGEIRARNKWVGPDGKTVHATDDTVIRYKGLADGSRILDYEVTIKAPKDKPVVFGDTKEGSMAVRVPLWMTPPHSYTVNKKKIAHEGTGTIVNAEGIKNDDAWAKRSTWVDYYGAKDGKTYGIAMFDNPKNPRHPTWWHVRSYALFAANPFGKSDFELDPKTKKKVLPADAGDLKIEAGQSVTFRWRLYFHMGDTAAAKVAEQYKAYAAGK